MADPAQPVNTGEEISNAPPSSLGLDPQAQFRTLSKRVEELTDEISRLEKPKNFRLADILQIGAVVIAVLVAIFTAFGLNNRIDDLVKGQGAAEARISSQITASESRLGSRIDRLDDRLTKVGERTATIEGAKGTSK